mmetsp:Transcript_12383/g.18490  ORF Transcript_12383/g.18490 Transcript_12383/m.18490 type:complete len:206 (-) Transcript_12383:170-787(-)
MGANCVFCAPSPQTSTVQVVVIFSGKRKCGKDYVTGKLVEQLGASTAEIGRLSAPLKKAYAEENGLDYKKLLSDGPYKEKFRKKMIVWGEERRNKDPGFFARKVFNGAQKPVLIISDARRPTDLEYFQRSDVDYKIVTVRVEASEETRKKRNWVFTDGVDNVESECGLDGREWDFNIQNDENPKVPLQTHLDKLILAIRGNIKEA